MGKYYDNKRRDAWRKRSGHKTVRDVMAEEKAERERKDNTPAARVISQAEAEAMISGGSGGGGGESDKIVRLLESIDRKLDGIGRIG